MKYEELDRKGCIDRSILLAKICYDKGFYGHALAMLQSAHEHLQTYMELTGDTRNFYNDLCKDIKKNQNLTESISDISWLLRFDRNWIIHGKVTYKIATVNQEQLKSFNQIDSKIQITEDVFLLHVFFVRKMYQIVFNTLNNKELGYLYNIAFKQYRNEIEVEQVNL